MKLNLDPRNRLHAARRILNIVGIQVEVDSLAQKETIRQIETLSDLGSDESTQLVELVQSMNAFDTLVSENLREMKVGERYEDIRENFESIIKDLERKVKGAQKGNKVGQKLIDKIQERYVNWKRGDIRERFKKIKHTYEQVFADSDDQIRHENIIIDAYKEYRMALKEGVLIAEVLRTRANEDRDAKATLLEQAKQALDNLPEDADVLHRGAFEIALTEAHEAYNKADQRQDLATSLFEKLNVSYGISEAVMTRYAETTKVRETVQRQSALFYTANSGMMNILAATFTQLEATNENSQVLSQMSTQTNNMLGKIADNNSAASKIAATAIKTAYEAQITPEMLTKLYESTVQFKIEQEKALSTARATRDANLIKVSHAIKKGQEMLAQSSIDSITIARELKEEGLNVDLTSAKATKTKSISIDLSEKVSQKRNADEPAKLSNSVKGP